MARIFITGSSDGIGQAAAKLLVERGHEVTLHARNPGRAAQAQKAVPGAEGVLVGDISTVAGSRALAQQANEAGPWDAVVHNAGLGLSNNGAKTADGFASIFAVNSLAPYVLTALMDKPKRLLYVTSGLHTSGDDSLKDVTWSQRPCQSFQAYCDTKLHNVLLANAVARRWPSVQSCSLDPGWVQTKLGGSGTTSAPANAIADYATGNSSLVGDRTGVYFGVGGAKSAHRGAQNTSKQDEFVRICEELSGLKLPYNAVKASESPIGHDIQMCVQYISSKTYFVASLGGLLPFRTRAVVLATC